MTHALHFLPDVDHIYTLQGGRVVEEGTYTQLMSCNGAFRALMDDFGGAKEQQDESDAENEEAAVEEIKTETPAPTFTKKRLGKAAGTGKLEVGLDSLFY